LQSKIPFNRPEVSMHAAALRSCRALALLLAFQVPVAEAVVAGLFRAYVGTSGNDANPCTLSQPCRLLPAALAAVADGGEIWMLDSANYNTATVGIGKSVSILAVPGAVGSVLAVGGPAISVTTGGLRIALRNLVVAALVNGGGTDGVNVSASGTVVTIENSLIANLPQSGVWASGQSTVKIVNSTLRDNGSWGVEIRDDAKGEITRTQLLGNVQGGAYAFSNAFASQGAEVSMDECVVNGSGSGGVGIRAGIGVLASAQGGPGAKVKLWLTRSTIVGTDTAISAAAAPTVQSSIVLVSGSTIANNRYDFTQIGVLSTIRTTGDNVFADNGTGSGALTPFAKQ
jgi:hypothetical protein